MTLCIPIYTEDIVPGTIYMKDKAGRLDLLGQILSTGYHLYVHEKRESPSEENYAIHPFTVMYREKAYNTTLTLKILSNASLPGKKQLELANVLLDEFDILLEKA